MHYDERAIVKKTDAEKLQDADKRTATKFAEALFKIRDIIKTTGQDVDWPERESLNAILEAINANMAPLAGPAGEGENNWKSDTAVPVNTIISKCEYAKNHLRQLSHNKDGKLPTHNNLSFALNDVVTASNNYLQVLGQAPGMSR